MNEEEKPTHTFQLTRFDQVVLQLLINPTVLGPQAPHDPKDRMQLAIDMAHYILNRTTGDRLNNKLTGEPKREIWVVASANLAKMYDKVCLTEEAALPLADGDKERIIHFVEQVS